MSTNAKRAGNARYLAKFKTVALRIEPEEYAKIKEKAGEKSIQAYIMSAIREFMAKEEK